MKLNNNNAAIFHCEKTLAISPNNCKALYRLSVCYTNKGEFNTAEQILQKAIQQEPNNDDCKNLMLKIQQEKRDYLLKLANMSRNAVLRKNNVIARNLVNNNELTKTENIIIDIIVFIVTTITRISLFCIKFIWNQIFPFLCESYEYAMSYWIIWLPVTIWILIPLRIVRTVYKWVIQKLENAADIEIE